MKERLSKYVLETKSFDEQYGLLYNSKNNYFIRYLLSDFKDVNSLLDVPQIQKLLEEKEFLYCENEFHDIQRRIKKIIKSEETLMLILKVTKDCNFRCIYCYEQFSDKNMSVDVQDNIISFIKNKINMGTIKHLIISWFGGEPLMNMECIRYMGKEIKCFCELRHVKYSSSVVTNGFLLNRKVVKELVDLGVNTFQITIDGDAEIHNKQRRLANGLETYSVIKNNLFDLKNLEGDFQIVLRTNISQQMLGNLDAYINDFSPLFKDKRFFAMYHIVVDFSDLSHDVTDRQVLNEIIYALDKGFRFTSMTDYLSISSKYCYAAKDNHFVVDVDGMLSKCTETNEEYSFIGKIISDGTIEKNQFFNIWRGTRLSDKCLDCENYSICGGGECPLYYLKHGIARCMKYYTLDEKELLLKVSEQQGQYNLTLRKK
ncbi:radical SAM/SPASM domain-containing protein [Amedibacillus dolichus]|uniref:radical SAM/SPASM domain-containing protein n=1 Tax=Amedibacillus dolichus TaxID=31971 RepID=UPI0029432B36|nr:radical SAM protein [Amedibacillus dolichus]